MWKTRNRVLVIGCLVGALAVPASAQNVSGGCVECTLTERWTSITKVDKTQCPGKNKVLCTRRYLDKHDDAECNPKGKPDLWDCKRVEKEFEYETKKYKAGTCGVDHGNTVTCPQNFDGAGKKRKRKGWTCEGKPWSIAISLSLAEMYTVSVNLPQGLTFFQPGQIAPLYPTVLQVPGEMLMTGVERGLIPVVDGFLMVELGVSAQELSRYSLPEQPLNVAVVEGNAIVMDAMVQDGEGRIQVAVPAENLGAFEVYSFDLAGMLVEAGELPEESESWEEDDTAPPEGAPSDPDELNLLVSVSSGEGYLTGGARLVGANPDAAPPEMSVLVDP